MKTKYTVYWTGCDGKSAVTRVVYDLGEALRMMEWVRNDKSGQVSAPAMCSEVEGLVGEMGAAAVVDGVLPNGEEYVYKTGRDRGRDPR